MPKAPEHSTKPTPQPEGVFPIRTLRDIFELPTMEHIELCLDELKELMRAGRTVNDVLNESLRAVGSPTKCVSQFPEVVHWKNDGKGEVFVSGVNESGEELLNIKFQMSAQSNPGNEQ